MATPIFPTRSVDTIDALVRNSSSVGYGNGQSLQSARSQGPLPAEPTFVVHGLWNRFNVDQVCEHFDYPNPGLDVFSIALMPSMRFLNADMISWKIQLAQALSIYIMAASDFHLTTPPIDSRQRELWLQHAIGFMLFKDVREYALDQISPTLNDDAKAAATKAINDTMYGMMMVLDGVTSNLSNQSMKVNLRTTAELVDNESGEVIESLDLLDGDGMCMGFHGWISQDFGDPPPYTQA